MSKLSDLTAKIKKNTDPVKAAVDLVTGVADQLDGLTHDPVAIGLLATELRESADALAKAFLDNTHTKPAATPTPTPPVKSGHTPTAHPSKDHPTPEPQTAPRKHK